MSLDMKATVLITVLFIDYATSQYPECIDATCPDSE